MPPFKHEGAEILYRHLAGVSRELRNNRPGLPALTRKLRTDIGSPNQPTRLLAYERKTNLPVLLSEEDRETHTHLIGATRQGKSKLLQLLIQGDIDRGFGCCLLDPSEGGDTANAVLKYCASIGFEKVVYINPHDFKDFDAVPVIDPIVRDMPSSVTVGNIKNALQILWQSEAHETPRIEKYIPVTLAAIQAAGGCLSDIKYFLDNDEDYFLDERWQIIRSLKEIDLSQYAVLRRPFTKKSTFENHYQPTVNRLSPFADPYLQLMFGSRKNAIPFADLIVEGWVILVNLDAQGVWGRDSKPHKLLGTMILDQVIHGVYRAQGWGWRGRFYLYVDEVGDFATPDIPYVIDKKSKTGLRLTVAHQRFAHIKDLNVLSSVRSIGNKVMFFVRTEDDRRMMMRDMGYGGSLPLDEVSFELGHIAKQEAVFTINKQNPVLARLVDVDTPDVSDEQLSAFKRFIYGSYKWMHAPKDIETEIRERFTAKRTEKSVLDPSGKSARDNVQHAREYKKVVKNRAKADRRAARETGQRTAAEGRPKAVFSEEE
jgi:hypothetical protein